MKKYDEVEIKDLLNNITNSLDVINEDISSLNIDEEDKGLIDSILYDIQEMYIIISSLEEELL
jgi:hypothetical protein